MIRILNSKGIFVSHFYFFPSAVLSSSSSSACRFASTRSNLIYSSHFCSAIFNSRSSFSAWRFFLRNELLLALDVLVDSLDGNNFSVWSLFPFETLISDTITQSLSMFQRFAVVYFSLFDTNFTRWLNNSILFCFSHFCCQIHSKYPGSKAPNIKEGRTN